MPHPIRKSPTAFPSDVGSLMSLAKNCSNAQNEIQNAPYDVNAVAPNVLPVRNSHIPASSCARPPYASARPSTIGTPFSFTRPELKKLSTNVVSANAASPSGPGSAVTGFVSTGAAPLVSARVNRPLAVSPAVGSSVAVPPPCVGSRIIRPSISPPPVSEKMGARGQRTPGHGRPCICNSYPGVGAPELAGRRLPAVDLDQHGVALAAARADARHAEAAAPATKLVHERAHDPRAARPERVAECDRAAVHVHLALVDTEHPHRIERDRRKRLVDLEQLDVVDRDAELLEQLLGRVTGRAREVSEVVVHLRMADHSRQHLAAVL